jgi:hypothetical protein
MFRKKLSDQLVTILADYIVSVYNNLHLHAVFIAIGFDAYQQSTILKGPGDTLIWDFTKK